MNTKCRTCRIAAAAVLILMISNAVADKYLVIPSGKSTRCDGPDEVISAGGRCWKDRNLGASQVATSATDMLAYGDYFQWGRPRDGHQHYTSGITVLNSLYDDPEHDDFIADDSFPYDWRIPHNNILWQGLSGINNPCPQGFRIPTETEWETERLSWDTNDAEGAFDSPLKLVKAGLRSSLGDGSVSSDDFFGYYWSSTISSDGSLSRFLGFNDGSAFTSHSPRANGLSVRCIKD